MSLESYTGNIADLVVTNPQPTDPKSQGDDHLRGIKYTLQQSFPGFDGPLNATRVPFTPAGNIAASNVQAAIQELDSETQAGLATKVSKYGDTMTGPLTNTSAIFVQTVAPSFPAVWVGHNLGDQRYIGYDNSTADLVFNNVANNAYVAGISNTGVAAAPYHLTRKDYVDGMANARVAKVGDTMTGALNMDALDLTSHNINFTTNYGYTGYIRGEHVPGTETKVVIGTTQGPKYWQFKNNGSAYGDAWVDLSDARTKSDIQPITEALAKTLTLRGCTFLRNGRDDRSAGLIAQDVQAVLPEAAEIVDHETGYLGLDATGVVGLLVEAVKELSAKLDAAVAEIAALKADK